MQHNNNKHLFIFGLGYVGTAVSQALLQLGWQVSGTTRNWERANELATKGVSVFIGGKTPLSEQLVALNSATHILSTVPPTKTKDDVFDNFANHLHNAETLEWFGYLSSSVVYGDCHGAWIDETTIACPDNDRGRIRLLAEIRWLKTNLPAHIFRISGIYGPGRNNLMNVKLGQARPIVKKDHVFCRIHLDDIVAALIASMLKPKAGNIYNLSDDLPASSHDVISYAAQLLDMAAPKPVPIEDADLGPMAMSFYDGCRRVSNDKIKSELGLTLKYPTYKEGLAALLHTMN